MKRILVLLSITFFSCHNNSKNSPSRVTIPVEHIDATPDQQARRKRSEAFCKEHEVPFYTNPTAMFTDPEERVELRTKDSVVDRVLALCYIGLKSEGLSKNILDQLGKDWQIMDKLSPEEKGYVMAAVPTDQQRTNANWRYEDLHVLLWSLGFVDSLDYPNHMCVVANDVKILHDLKEPVFRQKARLRSKKEILDQADLILRLDWACVNARTKTLPAPAGLNGEVVTERHYALNWLIGYLNQAWDNVRTDT